MRLALVLALLAAPALAQTTGVATLGIGDYSQLSFVRPAYFAGLGLEKQVGPVEIAASFLWSPGEKDRVRIVTPILAPTWNGTAQATALLRLGPALVGGGGIASITRESDYTKENVRPHAVLGAEIPIDATRLRATVSHLFEGSDESNHLRGERVTLRLEIPQAHWRHRIGFDVGFWRFHESNNPNGAQYARRSWLLTLGECF